LHPEQSRPSFKFNTMKRVFPIITVILLLTAGCTQKSKEMSENPFFSEYSTPFQVPPFEQIRNEHFKPAIEEGIARQKTEIEEIANNPEDPTFENTLEALDRSGELLNWVQYVFENLQSANTNSELQSIAEEMGVTLNRTGFSPNIKERRDFSCAIFDQQGEMIAQAAHIPVHLGSMPMSVKSAMHSMSWEDGDMVILNDPFKGGTHLPDITIVAPVFAGRKLPSFYVANRAHHADVGGMSSGSMPLSHSIFQEGIIIPPLKIVERGSIDRKLLSFFLNNVRTPAEREGDFAAQIMANMTGVRRTQELIERYGLEMVDFYANNLIDYAERITRKTIETIPDGRYEFEDFMDDDGLGDERIKIKVILTVRGDETVLDFSDSHKQVNGSINAVYAITLSAVLYVFRSLIEEEIPTNAGCLRPVTIVTKKGSIVDASFPAAVAGGNVETSQRIVDVVLGALFKAVPEKISAASQGTMNNITIGGIDDRNGQPFTYYETLGGGMGATAKGDGETAEERS